MGGAWAVFTTHPRSPERLGRCVRGAVGRPLATLLAVVALALPARGSDVGAAPGAGGGPAFARELLESPELLGDPGGLRSRLQLLGLTLQLLYNQYLAWKPTGGVHPDGTFGHSASYDFFTVIDFEAMVGWPGLDALLHVKGQYDRNINPDVGALSDPIDDADFDEPIWVDELWLQQAFFEDRLRLRAGFFEQQTIFDRNAYANSEDRQFLTTFLDNNPVVPLPNGLGAALLVTPASWLEIALGAGDADNLSRNAGFDTAFDGVDSLTGYLELTLRSELVGSSLPGSYRAGVFVDGRDKIIFGRTDSATGLPATTRGHLGAYLSLDQAVFRERPESEQGLGLFARFGYADPYASVIAWFWSVGFQYEGLLPWRDVDRLGVGVYQALGSARFRREVDPDFDRETGLEIYYRIRVLPWFAVTPDFQYIVDPGATGEAPNAVVAALRFRVTF